MDSIKFLVCPHDTASNPDKWYHFAQYLTQEISNSIIVNFLTFLMLTSLTLIHCYAPCCTTGSRDEDLVS